MPYTADSMRKLQARLGPFWWHSALMFGASRIGDVLNLAVGLFVVPLFVSQEQLGALLPLLSLAAFVSFPLGAAARAVSRYLTEFRVANEEGRIRAILGDLMCLSGVVSAVGLLILLGGFSFWAERLKIEGISVLLLLVGLSLVSCWQPILGVANEGLGHYYRITATVLVSGLARVLLAVTLLPLFGLQGYLATQLLAAIVTGLFLLRGFRRYFRPAVVAVSNRALLRSLSRYFFPVLAMSAVLSLQAVMEPWIVRQRLPEEQSAAYYVATRFGMIPQYLAGALTVFIFPMASERHDRGESTRAWHGRILLVVLAVGGASALLLWGIGPWLLDRFVAWRPYAPYASLLWKTALVSVGSGLVSLYALHESACRRFRFLRFLIPVILLEIGGLYSLMGWSFFRPYVPAGIWGTGNLWIRRDVDFVVGGMLLARLVLLLCMAPGLIFERGRGRAAAAG
jgi:O-antigen/teichoic acid export membrane protein